MGGEQFDEMTRGLASGGTTRRRMLRNAVGAMAGAALAGLGVWPAAAAPKSGEPKKPHSNNGDHGNRSNNGNNGPGGPVGNPGPNDDPCDNCNWMCSNCPIACCAA